MVTQPSACLRLSNNTAGAITWWRRLPEKFCRNPIKNLHKKPKIPMCSGSITMLNPSISLPFPSPSYSLLFPSLFPSPPIFGEKWWGKRTRWVNLLQQSIQCCMRPQFVRKFHQFFYHCNPYLVSKITILSSLEKLLFTSS